MVSDPATFTRFIGNVAKHLTVDNSLSRRGDPADRVLAPADRRGHRRCCRPRSPAIGTTPDGQSILTSSTRRRLAELSTALKSDTMADYVKKYPEG